MSSIAKVRRLLQLIERLQSGRHYNAKDLAELCGVSRRTIFRDLKMLQDSGVPVLYDEERQGYWLAAATFLPPTDFTLEETLALLVLAHELGGGEKGIPFQHPAREAALKLLSNLPGHLRTYVGELTDSIEIRTEAHHPLIESRGDYDLLVQAVSERRRIRLVYRSLWDGKDITTLLSPYRLLFVRRAWYAIGRSSLHRSVRTFHVGRILSAELTDDRFDIPPRFSLERYLGHAWHLVRERGRRVQVAIRFQPLVASNVAEVAWHRTQRLTWNADGTLDFHVLVDGLREISWWILGYGDQAEVLEPPELRDLIVSRIESMQAIYRPKRGRRR